MISPLNAYKWQKNITFSVHCLKGKKRTELVTKNEKQINQQYYCLVHKITQFCYLTGLTFFSAQLSDWDNTNVLSYLL